MFHSRSMRRALAVAGTIVFSAVLVSDASAQRGDRGRDRDSRDTRDTGRQFYATTSQNLLLQFSERRPDRVTDTVPIRGLRPGVTLNGIDFRPATGDLYGIGSDNAVYRVSPNSGIAVAENRDAMGNPIPYTPAAPGMSFGFDFNPTVDKIRITSDAGANLRLNVDEGTLLMTDGNLNPGTPRVVGSAYTNSSFVPFDQRPMTTILYALDAATNQVFVQNPPNAGTLTNGQRLGFRLGTQVGFDIAGPNNRGYVANRRPNSSRSTLYRVNPVTGASRSLGSIGSRSPVTGLAAVQD
jgi:Domain of unknown function (DUF4394)